jgi:hypothetical protein
MVHKKALNTLVDGLTKSCLYIAFNLPTTWPSAASTELQKQESKSQGTKEGHFAHNMHGMEI